MAISTRECAAVTGACLATRRDVFESLGGFDEALGVDLSDVDYCLRAQRAGHDECSTREPPSSSTTNRPVGALPEGRGTSDCLSIVGDPPLTPVIPI